MSGIHKNLISRSFSLRRKTAVCVLLLGFMLPVVAHAARMASVKLDKASALPGQNVTVEGKRFDRLSYGDLLLDGSKVGRFWTDLRGRFSTRFMVPAMVAGERVLTARTSPWSQASQTFIVQDSWLFADDFESYPLEPWEEGEFRGGWQVNFDGYGHVRVSDEDSRLIELSPTSAQHAGATHAALVTTVDSFADIDVSLRMRSVEQLRNDEPNPWEVAWVLWSYRSNQQFYYFILKPNGWELGKADPNYPGAQRFLATGSNPEYELGVWNNLRVRQVGSTMEVWADGELLTRFTDHENAYTSGALGLYTEDATVQFDDIELGLP